MKFSEYLKTSDFRSKQCKRGWKLKKKGGVVGSKDRVETD